MIQQASDRNGLRVTVVTPSYNQEQFLERTLQSVLTQNYPNLEYIVLDGGSSDRSSDIIHALSERLDYWAIAPDGGQSAAISAGWMRSNGDVLCWLNSDDVLLPGALHAVAQLFAANPSAVMLFGAIAIIDAEDRKLGIKQPHPVNARSLLPWGRVPGQPAVFIRREVFTRLGGPRSDLHYVMDWELWLRIALAYPESRMLHTDTVLAGSREWGATKTNTAEGRDAAEVRRVLAEVFARADLPAELRALEQVAYARTWWRQSRQEARAHRRGPAFTSLAKALRFAPSSFGVAAVLKQTRRILIGERHSRANAIG